MIRDEKEQYNKESYLNLYHLSELAHIQHSEFILFHKKRVFTQSFMPKNRKGTVLIIHGYLDHSGAMANLIRFLVSESYGVLIFDLPGHGFSSGKRGDIGAFKEYEEILASLIASIQKSLMEHEPFFAIGHSTGAAILFEFLSHNKSPFAKIIVVAPLIRPFLWSFSKIGVKLIEGKIRYLKRAYRRNSADKKYLEFVRRDPLQFNTLPTNWLLSMNNWYQQFITYSPKDDNLYIIQGNHDKTVDWKYNIALLVEKFPGCNPILIDRGMHQLFNEQINVRDLTFFHIKRILHSQD